MDIQVKVSYKNKIKSLREAAGLSQSQLAKKADVNLRTYQYYEQGVKDINKAQLSTLLKICNALNCALNDILTDPDTLTLLKEYNSVLR